MILGIIKAALGVVAALTQIAERRQLMSAGEAAAMAAHTRSALRSIERAVAARRAAGGVRDEDYRD